MNRKPEQVDLHYCQRIVLCEIGNNPGIESYVYVLRGVKSMSLTGPLY